MPRFTNSELADMHFTYGLADGNALMDMRIYQERSGGLTGGGRGGPPRASGPRGPPNLEKPFCYQR